MQRAKATMQRAKATMRRAVMKNWCPYTFQRPIFVDEASAKFIYSQSTGLALNGMDVDDS